MAQITWRNINGPSNAGVADLLRGAQQSVGNAVTGLNSALNQFKTTQEDQAKQQFLDSLAQYRDPQAYQQAVQSGAIDQLRQQAGAWLPAGVARDAIDNRLSTLQERALNTAKYEDTTRTRDERDTVDLVRQLMNESRFDEATRVNQANDTLLQGTLAGEIRDAKQGATRWDQDNQKFDRLKITWNQDDERHSWNQYGQNRRILDDTRNDAKHDAEQLWQSSVKSTLLASQTEQQEKQAQLAQLADSMNIPVINGQPNLRDPSISGDLRQAFLQRANSAGILDYTGDTQRIQQLEQALLQSNLPVTPEMVSQARQLTGNQLQQSASLAPTDQAELDTHLKKVDETFEAALSRNPMVKAALDPAASTVEVMDFLTAGGWDPSTFGSDGWFNDAKAKNLVNKVNGYLSGGISLEGEAKAIQVTPGLVKLALQAANAGGSSATADTFEETLKEIVKNPAFLEAYKEGLTAKKDWETNRTAVTQSLRMAKGLPANDVPRYIQSLNLMLNN